MHLQHGDIISGRFRIDGFIGAGQMGFVYKATHLGTGQVRALKFLRPDLASNPGLIKRFLEEAKHGGRIGRNESIVEVVDTGYDERSRTPFIVMEFVDGKPLDQVIANPNPIPLDTIQAILEQLGEALDQAHQAPNGAVIHRDLKPANLLLCMDRKGKPRIKITDFGIAKALEGESQNTATQVGSPAYAAPEQAGQYFRNIAASRGIVIAKEVSPGTDVWALGLLAFELFSGRKSTQFWNASTTAPDLIAQVTLEAAPRATHQAGNLAGRLPPGFDAWLDKCLQKNAADRFASAGAAVQSLIQLMNSAEYKQMPIVLNEKTMVLNDLVPKPAQYPQEGPANTAAEKSPAAAKSIVLSDPLAITQQTRKPHPKPWKAALAAALAAGFSVCFAVLFISTRPAESDVPKPSPPPPIASSSPENPTPAPQAPATEDANDTEDTEKQSPPGAEAAASAIALPPSSTGQLYLPAPPGIAAPQPSAKAFLNMNTIPASQIVLDGRPIGNTPKVAVPIAPGLHTVAFFHKESQQKKSFTVIVNPGQTKTVTAKFSPR